MYTLTKMLHIVVKISHRTNFYHSLYNLAVVELVIIFTN